MQRSQAHSAIPEVVRTLIHLNAAFVSWQTVSARGRQQPPVRLRSIDGHSPDAQQDDSEVSNMAGTIYLLLLVAAFIGIVIWVFGRKRKARFEAHARIPLDNDKGNDDRG